VRASCRPALVPQARAGIAALLALAATLVPVAARPEATDRVDVVVMRNGDTLTCEIKELLRGQLRVKTDGMSTVFLDWDKVVRVTTTRPQEVQLSSGKIFYGPLEPAPEDGRLLVATSTGPVELELKEVVQLLPLRSTFWNRIDGSLSLGASYTQANKLLQLTPSLSAAYRARGYAVGVDFASTLTRQEGRADTDYVNAALRYSRNFTERWFTFGQASAQRNTALGLDLRAELAGGVGRFLTATNHSLFFLGAGLAGNREHPLEGDSASSLEAVFVTRWQLFSYSFPKTNLTFAFYLYPSLTESGRVRGDCNLSLKREVWRDFTFGVQFYDSFDNRPVVTGAAKNDWGATLSLGWVF
jgi:hypothetical protein